MNNKIINYLFLLSMALLLLSCKQDKEIIYENSFYKLTLNRDNGAIRSIEKNGKNMIAADNAGNALFEICFRDKAQGGEVVRTNSDQAAKCEISQAENKITIVYSQFDGMDISATVRVGVAEDSPFMNWNIEVDNNTPYLMDYIDFPNVVVPNDLVATGGNSRVFWPAQEGVVVEDMKVREEGIRKYRPIEHPNLLGWIGLYPSSAQMQFMAYYSSEGGLYMATHDDSFNVKGIEYCRAGENGIKMEYHLFTEGAGQGKYKLPYDMVIGTFEGDWHDAANIYRNWVESSALPRPVKIADNKELPDWYFESPVVVTYPVRGEHDMDDGTMPPNALYPYTNALPILEDLEQAFDSKVMSLLMHWEGSAPWAPPYAWPPYGGTKDFDKFVKRLHDKGNYIGLYASGIGYTIRSNTDTTFNMRKEFDELGLEKIMKKAPDGDFSTTNVCATATPGRGQRFGYDMCPANQFVTDVVVDQVSQMVEKGNVDYIQYFDQNLGGSCYGCYDTSHGHAYGPGKWQSEAMSDLYEALMPVLKAGKRKPLLGCEAAAAEPFMPYLLFNDNRATINFAYGTPVPAYQYVNHEYLNGFMGNQNSFEQMVDMEKSPLNMMQRLALAFVSGDMFTVILRGDGDMIESWNSNWDAKIPNQEYMKSLIKNLNEWRKTGGLDYLVTGRMIKPLEFEGTSEIPMLTKPTGLRINFPSVLSSNWESQKGQKAQFFVNYLPDEQEITIDMSAMKEVKILEDAAGNSVAANADKELKLKLQPLSAVMVAYSK
ncbi:MAG: hypothetical protein GY790_12100 [Bacteroidetes bacterium]|nr:hypothetical protein [Bacteroidota bacterium]